VQAIEAFQKDPSTTVFLLSMRSGAVGINLTSANYVFVLEPALNPGLEEQAVGRAWRMGQQRPVTVKKLYVKVLFMEMWSLHNSMHTVRSHAVHVWMMIMQLKIICSRFCAW